MARVAQKSSLHAGGQHITQLDNAIGAGALIGIPLWQRFSFVYEGDFAKTKSSRVGDQTALNHRFDMLNSNSGIRIPIRAMLGHEPHAVGGC
jgi:hypothetical protein